MKMTKVKHLELVDAWWSGKLEICRFGTNWEGAKLPPDPLADPDHYRIRPQPKLRPWKPEEAPLGAEVRSKTEKWRGLITLVGVYSIAVGLQPYNFTIALLDLEHSLDGGKTWKPCGVEE